MVNMFAVLMMMGISKVKVCVFEDEIPRQEYWIREWLRRREGRERKRESAHVCVCDRNCLSHWMNTLRRRI